MRLELNKAFKLASRKLVHFAIRQGVVRVGKVGIDADRAHIGRGFQRRRQPGGFFRRAQADAVHARIQLDMNQRGRSLAPGLAV